jgi:hypothetical protein
MEAAGIMFLTGGNRCSMLSKPEFPPDETANPPIREAVGIFR